MKILINFNPYIRREYNNITENLYTDPALGLDSCGYNSVNIYEIFRDPYKLYTLIGGINGHIYSGMLDRYDINWTALPIRDNIREKVIINSDKKEVFMTRRPRITNEELEMFYGRFIDAIRFGGYVQLLGTDFSADQILLYKNMIKIANKRRVPTAVFLSADWAVELVATRPSIVFMDRGAVEAIKGSELMGDFEVSKIAKDLIDKGSQEIIYINDKGNLSLYTKERNYRTLADIGSIDKSSIDPMMSSYISAVSRRYEPEMRLKLALGAGQIKIEQTEIKKDAAPIKKLMKGIEVEDFNVSR